MTAAKDTRAKHCPLFTPEDTPKTEEFLRLTEPLCQSQDSENGLILHLYDEILFQEQELIYSQFEALRTKYNLSLKKIGKAVLRHGSGLPRSLKFGTLKFPAYRKLHDYFALTVPEPLLGITDLEVRVCRYLAVAMTTCKHWLTTDPLRESNDERLKNQIALEPLPNDLKLYQPAILRCFGNEGEPEIRLGMQRIIIEQLNVEEIQRTKGIWPMFDSIKRNVAITLQGDVAAWEQFAIWQEEGEACFISMVLHLWNNWALEYFVVEELLYDLLRQPERIFELYMELASALEK